jgi:hypothetical protein
MTSPRGIAIPWAYGSHQSNSTFESLASVAHSCARRRISALKRLRGGVDLEVDLEQSAGVADRADERCQSRCVDDRSAGNHHAGKCGPARLRQASPGSARRVQNADLAAQGADPYQDRGEGQGIRRFINDCLSALRATARGHRRGCRRRTRRVPRTTRISVRGEEWSIRRWVYARGRFAGGHAPRRNKGQGARVRRLRLRPYPLTNTAQTLASLSAVASG